jgi:hypothetical protein
MANMLLVGEVEFSDIEYTASIALTLYCESIYWLGSNTDSLSFIQLVSKSVSNDVEFTISEMILWLPYSDDVNNPVVVDENSEPTMNIFNDLILDFIIEMSVSTRL